MFQELLNFFSKKKDTPYKFPGISQDSEKVNLISSEFDNALAYYQDDLDRQDESWGLYSGINDSQYSAEVKAQMAKENRNPFQGNIIRSKVDGLAGSVIKNFYDVSFEAVNGDNVDLTRYIKELMLIDKELLDWNSSYRELVVDGLIHLGVEEIYIDYRYNPLGNIGFRRILPGHILLDPDWLTNNAWDLRKAWKSAYLTPKQMKQIYKTKANEIDTYIKMKEGDPEDFDNGNLDRGVIHNEQQSSYADKYRVIEYHHVEKETKKVEIDIETGMVIPEGNEEFKKEWGILNGVNFTDGVITREEEIDVYYVTTICPSLSNNIVLEDRRGVIQIGRLPFFPWSSARINGKNSGIPDLLKSIQQTYNFRESMLDYMIKTSPIGGKLVDPALFDNDINKMQAFIENSNNPSFVGFTATGALASGRNYFQELPRSTVDYGIVNELTRMLEMFDMVSKQSSTMDGQSSGSEDSGIFFARRALQSEIAQTLLVKSLEQLWNEKGEAYLLLAKTLYSGVYREFYIMGSKEKIELNKPIVTPSGEVIENDISQLPRTKVIVSQSPEGVTTRTIDRSVNSELLRVLPPENYLNRTLAVKNVMKTLDNAKSEREQYNEASEIEYTLAKERALTEIMNLKASQMQIQQQLMMAQQPQLPGMDQVPQGGQQGEQPQPAGNPAATMQGNNMLAASPNKQ
jgi:hypothetical protein